jgi:hypothetical protein
MRGHLAQGEKHYYQRQKQAAFIEAMDCYCSAVGWLAKNLAGASIASEGFTSFRTFLTDYVHSGDFGSLVAETHKAKSDLARIKYRLLIQGNRITVTKCEDEPDYRADVLATFEKFQEGAAKRYRFDHRLQLEMNHVEAAILDLVVQLFPEVFAYWTSTRVVTRSSGMTRSPDSIGRCNSTLPVSSSSNL